MHRPDGSHYLNNVSAGTISRIVGILLSMWFARVVTENLGVDGYGLVSMAASLTMAVGIFATSMNSAIGRYLTVGLSNEDFKSSNRVFNSTLWASTAIVLLLVPFVLVVAWHSPTIFSVVDRSLTEVRVFVSFTLLASLVLALMPVFTASCFAVERLDLLSVLQAGLAFLRVGTVILLLRFWNGGLVSVGLGKLIAAVVTIVVAIFLWHRLTPDLCVDRRYFSWGTLSEMSHMGLWVAIDSLGMLLVGQMDPILAGNLLGTRRAGLYGLYLTFALNVPNIGAGITNAIGPRIYSAYAKGDEECLDRIAHSGIRVALSFMALLVAVLLSFQDYLLELWLGRGYGPVGILLTIGGPLLAFATSLAPFAIILNARKRTRWIAVATVVSGICHIVTCLVLHAFDELTIFTMAMSGGLWIVVKMFLLVLVEKEGIKASVSSFLRQVYSFSWVLIPPVLMAVLLRRLLPSHGGASIAAAGLLVAWLAGVFWVLKPSDMKMLMGEESYAKYIQKQHQALHVWKSKHLQSRNQSTYTHFLRLPLQLVALTECAMDSINVDELSRPLSILVLGCSSGCEVYSIASEVMARRPNLEFEILGLDIERSLVHRASRAIYSQDEVWSNRLISPEFVQRTFNKLPSGKYQVCDRYRAVADFDYGNVLSGELIEKVGEHDIVCAQNFLIHMRRDDATTAFWNIVELMASRSILLVDGIDLDLKVDLTRNAGLEPLDCMVREIHQQNERRASWAESYVGLEPFDSSVSSPSRRYSTIFLKNKCD